MGRPSKYGTDHDNTDIFDRQIRELEKAEDRIARTIAVTALNFFEESFDNQGFTDRVLSPWEKRAEPSPRNTRKLLVDSGALSRSLTIRKQTWPEVIVASEGVDYARIHNEGGTLKILITESMRRYFWAMYYETGHNAYKYMAITKETYFRIEIPQRKFMGHSETLNNRIHKEVREEIRKATGL